MKINEILVEQQLDELGWGDVGKTLGKGLGAVGAIGGAVPGAWDALKHGYQVGRGTVGGAGAPVQAQQAAQWSQQQAALKAKQKQVAAAADQQSRLKQATPADQPPEETPAVDPALADQQAKFNQAAQAGQTTADPNAPVGNVPAASAPTAGTTNLAGTLPTETPAQQQKAKVGLTQIRKIVPTLGPQSLQKLKAEVDRVVAQKAKTPAKVTPTQPGQVPVQTATSSNPAVNPAAQQGFGAVAESAEVGIYSKFLGKNI